MYGSNGRIAGAVTLEYAGETSLFAGLIPLTGDADRLVVIASQPDEANFGQAEAKID